MSEVQAFGKLKHLYEAMPAKEIAWIAGGALRSFLMGDRVKDLDIFSADPDSVISAFDKDKTFTAGFKNDFIANYYKDNLCYQVIRKYKFQSPQETIDNFDFTIICAAIGKNGIIADERFYIDNAQRRLVVKSLPKPLSSVKRALKYSTRGYLICSVGLAKILKVVQQNPINWDDPKQNEIEFYPDGTPNFMGLD